MVSPLGGGTAPSPATVQPGGGPASPLGGGGAPSPAPEHGGGAEEQNAEDEALYDNTEDEPVSEVDDEAPTQHQPVLTRRAQLTRAQESRATLGVNPTAHTRFGRPIRPVTRFTPGPPQIQMPPSTADGEQEDEAMHDEAHQEPMHDEAQHDYVQQNDAVQHEQVEHDPEQVDHDPHVAAGDAATQQELLDTAAYSASVSQASLPAGACTPPPLSSTPAPSALTRDGSTRKWTPRHHAARVFPLGRFRRTRDVRRWLQRKGLAPPSSLQPSAGTTKISSLSG